MRGGNSSQLFRNAWVKEGRVQVGAHLTHDEGWPRSHQTSLRERLSQQLHEALEALYVCQSSSHLFRSHLVGDRVYTKTLALGFGVFHELHGTLHDNPYVKGLVAGYCRVDGGIYVEQRITSFQAGGDRPLHFFHCFVKL